MSDPEDVTIKEGDAEWASLRQGYLGGLLEDFIFTGDYQKLREYVKEGGDLDVGATDKGWIREIVTDMMGPDFAENPKGNKDAEMITFYMAVCARMMSVSYQTLVKRNTVSAATRYVAANHRPHPIEFKTAEKQYSEGRKRFIDKFDKPWIET